MTAEQTEIMQRAKSAGTWLKAPNGEDSKLTPEQWTAVRTSAFKRWFGDWEAVSLFRNAYRRIMSMAPVAALTGNEFSKAWTPDIMVKYWNSVCGGKVLHPELGYILLTRRSAKDCLAHGAMREKIAVFYKVHDVIKNGVIFDEKKNWKGRGYDICSLAASVTIAGKEYICQVIVKRLKDRNQFYLHEVELKEKLPTEERTGFYTGLTSGGAEGLLAQKAEEVNTLWEKCSKILDENGEPLVVYHVILDKPHKITQDITHKKARDSRARIAGLSLLTQSRLSGLN